MAFDLNKKADKKKFDLSKSKDASSEIDTKKKQADSTFRPDLTKKKNDSVPKPDLAKKKNEPLKPDLSKEKVNPSSNNSEKKKPVLLVFYLLGVMVLALGIWYFIAHSNSDTAPSTTKAITNSTPPAPLNNSTGNASTSSGNNNVSTNPEIKNNTPVTAASLNNKVLANFEPASSSLISVDDATIKNLTGYLSQNAGAVLTVYGFASSEGDFSFNQSLSQQRADACKNYLTGKGIPANRILTIGKGIENPISSNDTEEGRTKNRRVEIVLK